MVCVTGTQTKNIWFVRFVFRVIWGYSLISYAKAFSPFLPPTFSYIIRKLRNIIISHYTTTDTTTITATKLCTPPPIEMVLRWKASLFGSSALLQSKEPTTKKEKRKKRSETSRRSERRFAFLSFNIWSACM